MVNHLINSQETEEKFTFLEKPPSKITPITSRVQKSPKNSELPPEVVTVDLAFPEAKNQISFVAQSEARKLILAVNACDKEEMLEAIALGASGSTSKEIEEGEMQLVLESLQQECLLVDAKRKDFPHFLVLPKTEILSKLEQYQYVLGAEIINYWRGQSFPVPVTIASMLKVLGIARWTNYLETGQKFSLTEELDRLISGLRQNKEQENLVQKLEYINKFVETWYFKRVCPTVNSKARDLRKRSISKFKKISLLWTKGGSYTLSAWLEEAISSLKVIETELEEKRQEALKRSNSALVASQKLTKKLQQDLRQEDFESALRGLKFRYQEMMTFEIAGAASQILTEVIELLEAQRQEVIASDNLLYGFQEKLQRQKEALGKDCTIPESIWSGEELEGHGVSVVRQKLEQEIGKSLNYLGKLSIEKHETIYLKILKKSRKLALNLILKSY